MAADWLRCEIASGLQKLLTLRLVGTPPEDAIVGTAEVWLEAMEHCGVEWVEHLDRERVQRAFKAVFRLCDRWPAPKLFIDHLGNRDPPKALPEPPVTREERQKNRAKLRKIMESLAKSKRMSNAGANNDYREQDS